MAKAMKAMKVMKKKAAMKAMKVMKKKAAMKAMKVMKKKAAMKAMKVMKKKAAMKAMKVMKKKAVTAMPKSGIAAAIADETELKKSDVSKVLVALTGVATEQVSKAGKFAIPGLVMLKKKVKPARAAGKKMMFGKEVKVKAAKAKTIVKAYCVKALKDSI